MTKNNKPIEVAINAPNDIGQFNISSVDQYQLELKKIYEELSSLSLSDIINDPERYNIVSIDSARKIAINSPDNEDKIVYQITKALHAPKWNADDDGNVKSRESTEGNNSTDSKIAKKDRYLVSTGLYIGVLIINGQKLVINSGYNQTFLKRLVSFSNNFYIDSSNEYDNANDTFDLSNILEYLFLSTLKSCLSLGIPKRYSIKAEKGWNIKGKINWERYFSIDSIKKDGFSFSYREQVCDENLLTLIYHTIKKCNQEYLSQKYKDILPFVSEIKESCKLSVPTNVVLNKCLNDTVLFNGIYAKYRNVGKYAEMILKHKELSPDNTDGCKAVGWILDISELWETYLVEILKSGFSDWNVIAQNQLHLYDGAFYCRDNFPDIIMEKGNHIIILDAKFKKMDFKNGDVDRGDLHQIQSYYAYYLSQRKYVIDYVGLVYPARDEVPEGKKTLVNMFGLKDVKTKFDVAYVKIADKMADQIQNERGFINRIRSAIDDAATI